MYVCVWVLVCAPFCRHKLIPFSHGLIYASVTYPSCVLLLLISNANDHQTFTHARIFERTAMHLNGYRYRSYRANLCKGGQYDVFGRCAWYSLGSTLVINSFKKKIHLFRRNSFARTIFFFISKITARERTFLRDLSAFAFTLLKIGTGVCTKPYIRRPYSP